MEKVKVETWKMAPNRYLHLITAERGYFHVVTDSSVFSLGSFTLRNKVLARKSTKEIRGLKKVKEEHEYWLNDDSWAILCFGGADNMELRKKVYGKELRKVMIKMTVYSRSGRVDEVSEVGGDNLISCYSLLLKRNLKKRIKDPLPYLTREHVIPGREERLRTCTYTISELSLIQFKKRIKEEWS